MKNCEKMDKDECRFLQNTTYIKIPEKNSPKLCSDSYKNKKLVHEIIQQINSSKQ